MRQKKVAHFERSVEADTLEEWGKYAPIFGYSVDFAELGDDGLSDIHAEAV
nr:hypothetical protein CKG001_02400 [Bdellovibrio sp. CKG001]BFD65345.1 hypothetical protein HAGR004_03670 [Bdellovibrio sp. HAGR004]